MEEKEICIAFFFLVWKLDFRFDQLHVNNQKAELTTPRQTSILFHIGGLQIGLQKNTLNPPYHLPPDWSLFYERGLGLPKAVWHKSPIIPSIMFSAPKMTALGVTPSSVRLLPMKDGDLCHAQLFDLSEMCFYQKVFPTFCIYKMPQQVYFSKKPTLFRNKAEEWELWVPP